MKYTEFGNTGKKISRLGYGCMRLPEFEKDGKWYIDEEKAIPMLHKAYELGVNYFDTAVGYCHENSQYTVGKAIKGFRDNIMLSTKLPPSMVHETGDFRRVLEQSLSRLDTPYIDFYHFHGIDKKEFDEIILKYDLINEARKAIDEGLIRHISFSFHDKSENMKYIIERGEIFSSVLMQYNLLDRSNEEVLAYAHEHGLGTVIMGPVAGGRLAGPSQLYKKLMGNDSTSTYELAIRFVLGNPNVSCALSGMSTLENVQQNALVADIDSTMSVKEHEKVKEMMDGLKKFSDLYCTGCSYCMPCPQGINIPHIFNCHTFNSVYGLCDTAKSIYSKVGKEERFGQLPEVCKKCGACAKKCPQHIDIPTKLAEIAREFN